MTSLAQEYMLSHFAPNDALQVVQKNRDMKIVSLFYLHFNLSFVLFLCHFSFFAVHIFFSVLRLAFKFKIDCLVIFFQPAFLPFSFNFSISPSTFFHYCFFFTMLMLSWLVQLTPKLLATEERSPSVRWKLHNLQFQFLIPDCKWLVKASAKFGKGRHYWTESFAYIFLSSTT